MEAKEYSFYGLGIIAFVMAQADGEIQVIERNALKSLIHDWSQDIEVDFDIAGIIFSILLNSKHYEEISYESGMKYIRLGSNHLDESLKEKFLFLIQSIAHTGPPITDAERSLLKKFESDLHALK